MLTFEEVGALLDAKGIVVEDCAEAGLGNASGAGRGYAISGGVAAAVKKVVSEREDVRPIFINGLSLQALRKMQSYIDGSCPGNLIEVMTCVGGCVGGAGVLAEADKAARLVDRFAQSSPDSAPRG